MTHNKTELLAPAGTLEQVEAAVLYGADAVYLGGGASLRAARPLVGAALHEARALTRAAGVKLYYCCNAFPGPKAWLSACRSLEEGAAAGADAFIIADPGVFAQARREHPHVPVHISTQAHTCNAGSVAFWQAQGAERVNLARELSLPDIRDIRKHCPEMELECFVHGAQCLALSGRCLLSAWLNGRPANAGQCTQPCRFTYKPMPDLMLTLEEARRPHLPLWDVSQGEEGYAALWAPEDLCLLFFVPWLVRQGINALKIEGRMRGGGYVAHTVDVYRRVLDSPPPAAITGGRAVWQRMLEELARWSGRPLGTGFFTPRSLRLSDRPERGPGGHSPVLARLEEERAPGVWRVSVQGRWQKDKNVRVVLPGLRRPRLISGGYGLENHRGEVAEVLHSGMEGTLHCALAGLMRGAYVEEERVPVSSSTT